MYYIVKTKERHPRYEAFLYGSYETKEEANAEMLNIYNTLYAGERKKALNWGIAVAQTRAVCYGAYTHYGDREVSYGGLLRFQIANNEGELRMFEEDYRTKLI